MPVILDWQQAGNHDDLIRQVINTLQQGKTVLLPTEVGYVLAVRPSALPSDGRPRGIAPDLELNRYNGVADDRQCPYPLTPHERAFWRRLWPEPVVVNVWDDVPPCWMVADGLTQAIVSQTKAIELFTINEGRAFDFDCLGDEVALIVNIGVIQAKPLTHVFLRDRGWHVLRVGAVSEATIRERLCRNIVFVCTGNTCRSPMAEAILKDRLATHLGCTVAELPQHGYMVSSVGLMAADHSPASTEAVAALQTWGIDLAPHRSRMASSELIAQADDVVVMTRNHLYTLVTRYPVLAGSVRLLCGAEGDLDDPFGGTAEAYRACANVVRQHVERLITEMGLS